MTSEVNMTVEEFLQTSYTAYHTVENCISVLEENGFVQYSGGTTVKTGGRYYAVKNGSALVAFKVGDTAGYTFNIAEAHTDSPVLRVKGRKLVDSPEGKRINVESYGGLIRYTFMNIPLKIAGRLFIKSGGGIQSVLVKSDFNVNIPSLCIHHNPDVNEKAVLSVQSDMLPLIGGAEDDLYKILLPECDVIDGDLFVVPDVKPFYSGVNGDFICSPRIDNLTSCYSAIYGLIGADVRHGVKLCALFDNEEIGSHTKQGAYSEFLPSLLKRITSDLKLKDKDYLSAVENGFILSIDNGHAVHPAHAEKSDITGKVFLNGGLVIKHHTNYSTDGFSSAVVKSFLDTAGVKYQEYYNNSDIRCGGTLGLVSSAQLQMNAADIGLAQLAMHSSIETVGVNDINLMTECVKAFSEVSFDFADDGTISFLK